MSAERSNKAKAMAAYMKAKGITRTSARCPMCHRLIQLRSLPNHILACGR